MTVRLRSCGKAMGETHATITHDALDLTVQSHHTHSSRCGPPAPIASDIWWSSLETCSACSVKDLRAVPSLYGHVVTTEVRTVGKQAVSILLECFLFFERTVGSCDYKNWFITRLTQIWLVIA